MLILFGHITTQLQINHAKMFPQQVISHGGDVPRPVYSPDLSTHGYLYGGVSEVTFSSLSLEP
jgi:hypothetical protein